ncbi:MAG: helix-turn-helix transcriptional regulator [Corynebacterium sp.]|uniref:helix-turn-helix transcriptional regulator n=1 Tax=Corynebacterium sp. TaxID=1720 RepID=UPI003F910752
MTFPSTPATDLSTAAAILGVSKSSAYKSVQEGTFPVATIKVGGRIVVPTAPLRKLLGLQPMNSDVA